MGRARGERGFWESGCKLTNFFKKKFKHIIIKNGLNHNKYC